MPHADRIYKELGHLKDIKVVRPAPAWIRLNADGSWDERTAIETIGDLGARVEAVASVALIAGNLVNLYDDGGVLKMRKANAALGLRTWGFVAGAVADGATGAVYDTGRIPGLSGLTPGAPYYLYTVGTVSLASPVTGLVQEVGVATSDEELKFQYKSPSAYRHVQGSAALTWTITHNLGRRPSFHVVNGGGMEVDAAVEHHGTESLTLTFINATLGSAELT